MNNMYCSVTGKNTSYHPGLNVVTMSWVVCYSGSKMYSVNRPKYSISNIYDILYNSIVINYASS